MRKRIAKLLLTAAVVAPVAGTAWADSSDWEAPLLVDKDNAHEVYKPLPAGSVGKPYHLCVAFPHMKDAYYVAKDYGILLEAKRQNVSASVLSAGGYNNLTQQIQQIEDCVARGGDAVLVNAVSKSGLNGLIEELHGRGIPVLDMGNGLESPHVAAAARAKYYQAGAKAGGYLAEKHPAGSGKVNLVWLAGPAGSQWVEDAVRGMQEAIAGSDVQLLQVLYGDTGKGVQMRLIEDALQAYADVDIIGGNAPAIEGAMEIFKMRGESDTDLIAFYTTPAIEKAVREGKVTATVGDFNVIGSRISVDQALRILENKLEVPLANRQFFVVDAENVNTYDRSSLLAPDGFEPVFEIEAGGS